MNLTGQQIKNTYQSLLTINDRYIENGTGSIINNINITSSNALSSSYSEFAILAANSFSASYAPFTQSFQASSSWSSASFSSSYASSASYSTQWGVIDKSCNVDVLQTMRRAAWYSNPQFRILVMGDSYCNSYNSVPFNIVTQAAILRNGYAGIGINSGPYSTSNPLLVMLTGSNVEMRNFTSQTMSVGWPFSHYVIAPSSESFVHIRAYVSGDGAKVNKIDYAWIASPSGGYFDYQYRKVNTTAWNTFATCNGYASDFIYRTGSYFLPTNKYEYRIVGGTGSNRVVLPIISDVSASGVVTCWQNMDGWPITNLYATSASVESYTNYFKQINPDLIIFFGAESAAEVTTAYNPTSSFVQGLKSASLSTPPVVLSTFPIEGLTRYDESEALRQRCIDNNWAFIDFNKEVIDANTLIRNGYMAAGDVHFTTSGSQVYGDYVWNKVFGHRQTLANNVVKQLGVNKEFQGGIYNSYLKQQIFFEEIPTIHSGYPTIAVKNMGITSSILYAVLTGSYGFNSASVNIGDPVYIPSGPVAGVYQYTGSGYTSANDYPLTGSLSGSRYIMLYSASMATSSTFASNPVYFGKMLGTAEFAAAYGGAAMDIECESGHSVASSYARGTLNVLMQAKSTAELASIYGNSVSSSQYALLPIIPWAWGSNGKVNIGVFGGSATVTSWYPSAFQLVNCNIKTTGKTIYIGGI